MDDKKKEKKLTDEELTEWVHENIQFYNLHLADATTFL